MKIQHHIASSTLVAGIVFLFVKSWNMALICLLSGVLIDADHVYDHIREFGLPFKIKHFFSDSRNTGLRQRVLVFHSWEVIFLLAIAAWLTNWNSWITGTLLGFGHHLVLDTLYYKERLRAFSFIWRWKNNFEYNYVFTVCARKELRPK